jgi:uncharacterized protein (UPF0548 family)
MPARQAEHLLAPRRCLSRNNAVGSKGLATDVVAIHDQGGSALGPPGRVTCRPLCSPGKAHNGAVFSLVPPPAGALEDLVREQAGCHLTYREAGATAATMPAGYRCDRWQIDLGGFDEGTFARLAAALRHWQPQRGAGIRVFPGEPVTPGLTFALVIPLPVGYATGAGRVTYITDQPEGYGFAYGTLPAHPEQGEEAFHIGRDGGRLVFTVTAFSRPRHPAARLGGPVTRALQLRANGSYLHAMRRAAAPEPP